MALLGKRSGKTCCMKVNSLTERSISTIIAKFIPTQFNIVSLCYIAFNLKPEPDL